MTAPSLTLAVPHTTPNSSAAQASGALLLADPVDKSLAGSSNISTPGDNPGGSVEGAVPHADLALDATQHEAPEFRQTLLQLLQTLRVPTWGSTVVPERIKLFKVSGSFTNAVFFVSYEETVPSSTTPHTVLLRIYGPSSSTFIDRHDELHMLCVLSSVYRIGPEVYGTFQNGRLEEWFDSSTLTAEDLRDPVQSRWIGVRMRELHNVDIPRVVGTNWDGQETVFKDIVSWQGAAQEALDMIKAKEDTGEIAPGHEWYGVSARLDLGSFMRAWLAYWTWLKKWEDENGKSERVFAHNDAQYGNLLRASKLAFGKPEHHKIIVVDFEYAAPNSAAYDIANHFHEWTANYHSPDAPHILTSSGYPTKEQRRNFYAGYLKSPELGEPIGVSQTSPRLPSFYQTPSSSTSSIASTDGTHTSGSISSAPSSPGLYLSANDLEDAMSLLDAQVLAWSPASHAIWSIWGIVQARDVATNQATNGFDYLGYASGRLEKFYRELELRGVEW